MFKKDNYKDELLEHISSKYDDNFEFVSISGGHLGSNSKRIEVYSEKYPGKSIYVTRMITDEGKFFYDTYLNVKYEKETIEYLTRALESEFGSVRMLTNTLPTSGSKNLTKESSLEEFMADPASMIYFKAVISCSENDREVILQKLKAVLREICVDGYIYFVDEPTQDIPIEEFNSINECVKSLKVIGELSFAKVSSEEYNIIEWVE